MNGIVYIPATVNTIRSSFADLTLKNHYEIIWTFEYRIVKKLILAFYVCLFLEVSRTGFEEASSLKRMVVQHAGIDLEPVRIHGN